MDTSTGQRLVELAQGVYVERDVLRIVEKIKEYDPNLDVQYLDPDMHPDLTDAPYRVVEKCRDGFTRVVFSFWKLDETVLERLYNADTQRLDVMGTLDTKKLMERMETNRRFEEKKAEDADLVAHILRNPKTTYTFEKEIEGDKKIVKIEDRGNG